MRLGQPAQRAARPGQFWACLAALNTLRATNPRLHYVMESVVVQVDPDRRARRDFEQVCKHLGEPVTFCASLVSPTSRQRNYWTNVAAGVPAQRDDRSWASALSPRHRPPLVDSSVDGRRQAVGHAPEVDALVWDESAGRWEAPEVDEVERMVGLAPGATASPGSGVAQRVAACRRSVNAHVYAHFLGALPDGQAAQAAGDAVDRRDLASLIGKWQFCAILVHGGQFNLDALSKSRDDFCDSAVAARAPRQQWHRNVRVRVSADAWAELDLWEHALADVSRPVFLSHVNCASGFWAGVVRDDDVSLDDGADAGDGVPVITADASGFGGGYWWGHRRGAFHFSPGRRAPDASSNQRELETAVVAVERYGPELQRLGHTRVLLRTDNTTTASVFNRKASGAVHLRPLLARLLAAEARYGLCVAARHIPGVDNGLADRLSRDRDELDVGDWMINDVVFDELYRRLGGFDIDAAAHPAGRNSHLPRYWSRCDSALTKDWRGLKVYANPDFDLAYEYISHGLAAYAEAPTTTSLTFVLPVWPRRRFWRKLRRFRVAAYYPAGTSLFTSPGRRQEDDGRVYRGATRWPVVVVHMPPAQSLTSTAPLVSPYSLGHHGEGVRDGAGAGDCADMPVLSGDPGADAAMLRVLLPGDVPGVLPAEAAASGAIHHLRELSPSAGAGPGSSAGRPRAVGA